MENKRQDHLLHLIFGTKNRYLEENKDWKKVDQTDFPGVDNKIYDWTLEQLMLLLNLLRVTTNSKPFVLIPS